MCSLRVSEAAVKGLEGLTKAGQNVDNEYEKRLFKLAGDANTVSVGILDNPSGKLKHMDADLQDVRHYKLGGRHRIYVTGSHKECSYSLWLIKPNKDTGKLTEGDKKFQSLLRTALENPARYLLAINDDTPDDPQMREVEGIDEPKPSA